MKPPKNKSELRVDTDHVWINLRGTWKRQRSVRNCNRAACWDLITHPKYSKIHALERMEKINAPKKQSHFFEYRDGDWVAIGSLR